MNSKIWAEYMERMLAAEEMKKTASEHLNPSVETKGVSNSGGGTGGVYKTTPAPCQGGAENFADPVVEGLEDIADAMLAAAKREPKGKHPGEEGIRASGSTLKPFTKQATGCMEMEPTVAEEFEKAEPPSQVAGVAQADEETLDLDKLLDSLSEGAKETSAPVLASRFDKKSVLATLNDLIEVANACDAEGNTDEADEIDAFIRAQLVVLTKTAKKK